MVVGFCSVGVDPTLESEKTCTDYGKWNASWVISKFYGWAYKISRLSSLGVDHSVVVITAGSQSRRSKIESYG